jgi:hypothetical protein
MLIQSEIEWFQVHLLEWLHIEALRDRLSCVILVTLGGCRHLDGLSSEPVVARVRDCSWPPPGDCEGFLCLSRQSAKGNSSGLDVSLSYLTCGSVLAMSNVCTRFVLHLLAAKPPSVGRHNGDVACRQAREPREKNTCVSCHLVFSRCID